MSVRFLKSRKYRIFYHEDPLPSWVLNHHFPSVPSPGIVLRVSICPSAVMNAVLCDCWAEPLFISPSSVRPSNYSILEVEAKTVTRRKYFHLPDSNAWQKSGFSVSLRYLTPEGASIHTPGAPRRSHRQAAWHSNGICGSWDLSHQPEEAELVSASLYRHP